MELPPTCRMKLGDLCVLVRMDSDKMTVLYMGGYSACVKRRTKDSFRELILKVGQSVNILNLELNTLEQ
jgi:hypothetical protein